VGRQVGGNLGNKSHVKVQRNKRRKRGGGGAVYGRIPELKAPGRAERVTATHGRIDEASNSGAQSREERWKKKVGAE